MKIRFPSIARVCLEKKLKKEFKKLKKGKILYVGSLTNIYKDAIPHFEFITMDIDESLNPDVVSDIHNIKLKSNQFDTVIAIQVLEHCHSPQQAVNEMHRVLKKGGVMVFSVPFVGPYHKCPKDYYRFAKDSLLFLTNKFKKVKIVVIGNRLLSIWQLISTGILQKPCHLLNPILSLLDITKDSKVPLGYIVIAKK